MRLDEKLVQLGLISSRSQAVNYIKLGYVQVDSRVVKKPSLFVNDNNQILLKKDVIYVSRAALKLESVSKQFKLVFNQKIVLDVGSSTGGFSDFALKNGAKKVIAVDVGSFQFHPSLINHPKIELHEKLDIRNFETNQKFDYILIDVSFISLKDIMDKIYNLCQLKTIVCVLVKPQFETQANDLNSLGIVKNDHIRRDILKKTETVTFKKFLIINKADSLVSGRKGNQERFYLLRKI